jgi:hypothetical protein
MYLLVLIFHLYVLVLIQGYGVSYQLSLFPVRATGFTSSAFPLVYAEQLRASLWSQLWCSSQTADLVSSSVDSVHQNVGVSLPPPDLARTMAHR